MTLRMHLVVIGFFLSINAFASSKLPVLTTSSDNLNNRWSVLASLGYGEYQHIYRSDGQTPIGRLAFAAELLTMSQAAFGLELGVQSGNRMRITIPQSALETLGCAVRTTMRPMLDLLVTAQTNPLDESLLFTQIKGGITYRHWQINSIYINDKSELAGELQAGLGYPLTEISNLSLFYQGIFGGNSRLRINPLTESGSVSNIPIQHGLLLGFSIIA